MPARTSAYAVTTIRPTGSGGGAGSRGVGIARLGSSPARSRLEWRAAVGVEDEFHRTVEWLRSECVTLGRYATAILGHPLGG